MQSLLTWRAVIMWLLITVGGSFAGAWFGAYFKKKGEDFAIKENLGELVRQMQALTKAQEEIKAEISDRIWNRQRQWEFKRDVLLEAVKRLGACHEAFTQLVIAFTAEGDTPGLADNRIERSRAFNESSPEFLTSARLLVDLVCGRECKVAFAEFGLLLRELGTETMTGDVQAFKKSREFGPKYQTACTALQKELGVGEAGPVSA
jgi:hypothetical protein